jgi:ureidoacrylate peracid hydrolase
MMETAMKAFAKMAGALATAAVLLGFAGSASADDLVKLPPLDKTLQASESAIVFVDFQNNFAAPAGEHYASYEQPLKDSHMIEKSLDLVKQARALGIQVVHVIEGYTADYRELDLGNGGGFHRAQVLRQAWKSGSWGVQLFDGLKPGPGDKDIVLPNRITVNGFGNTGLDGILKARGIRNIALGGFSTEGCVYATMLAGYDLGYRIFALPDVMASNRPELTAMMLKDRYPQYSRVMGYQKFLTMFQAAGTPKKQAAN